MRILFVLEHYHPYIGGAETLFKSSCEELVRNGYEVRVLTTRFKPGLPAEEVVSGVTVQRINCSNRFLFSLVALPAVYRWAGWARLIHTTTYNAAFPAWVGAKLRGKPVVITFHELWGKLWFRLPFLSWFSARLYYLYESLLLALPFSHYVAVSDFTARTLVQGGVDKSRVHRIYNGLDYAEFTGVRHKPPPVFTYTYFGRLGVSKGLDLILPAAAKFRERHPDSRLRLIIPKRPVALFEKIMAMIRKHGLEAYVELLHELPYTELKQAVASSSCVLIPSYSEGFCFVAAESSAMGVPIISSGRGALPETVSGTHLVMREMSVQGLVGALVAAREGNWQFHPLRKFELSATTLAYLEFYQGLEN